ncbi:MAG: hypothetical protein R3C68_06380 [Myxococcota bacterium]
MTDVVGSRVVIHQVHQPPAAISGRQSMWTGSVAAGQIVTLSVRVPTDSPLISLTANKATVRATVLGGF